MAIRPNDAAARERRRQLALVVTEDDDLQPITEESPGVLTAEQMGYLEAARTRELLLSARRYLAERAQQEVNGATVGVTQRYSATAAELAAIRNQQRDAEARILVDEFIDAVQGRIQADTQRLLAHTIQQLVKEAGRPLVLPTPPPNEPVELPPIVVEVPRKRGFLERVFGE